MKKVIVLSVFTLLGSVVYAQTTRHDVNVYTNPLKHVEYTPLMGSTYQRMMQMYQNSDRNRIERERLQLERDQMERREWMELERIAAAANAEGNKTVLDEVVTFNGINLATKTPTLIKARVIKKNNGNVDITCMGIKFGETWKPCNKSIMSLQKMYQSATSDAEKSIVLNFLDYGKYLLDTEEGVFIIK